MLLLGLLVRFRQSVFASDSNGSLQRIAIVTVVTVVTVVIAVAVASLDQPRDPLPLPLLRSRVVGLSLVGLVVLAVAVLVPGGGGSEDIVLRLRDKVAPWVDKARELRLRVLRGGAAVIVVISAATRRRC